MNHEQIIIQLTELNATKTRQLDELMRFIAYLLDGDIIKSSKEYLTTKLSDVQLVDGILYHVRKGK